MKKFLLPILIVSLSFSTSYAQCPVTAPNSDWTTADGGSLGCDDGSYKNEGGVSTSETCSSFTGTTCGLIWYGSSYSLTCGFCVSFTARMSTADVSDGLAFTMTSFSTAGFPCSTPIGCDEGGNIGYNRINSGNANIDGSLTVELDVFDNTADGDADADGMGTYCEHVAVVANGDNNTSEAFACVADLGDNTDKNVEICWDPDTDVLTVSIDGTEYISLNSDIVADYFGGNTDVHFGFSSGYNSGFTGVNTICNWTVVPPGTVDIKLIDFDIIKNKKSISLEWQTYDQKNNKFIVQRSNDGKKYSDIGEAISNTNKFNFEDKSPINGQNIYRLKQIDESGKSNYFKSESIHYVGEKINVYSTDKNIVINGIESSYKVDLININGQKIETLHCEGTASIHTENLTSGIYVLQFFYDNKTEIKKIIINSAK